jgi:hypothetical protein
VIKVLSHALRWLAARLGTGSRGRCACPACDEVEQKARTMLGVPARHPERIVGRLPGGQEKWLAAAAAALWPHGEYACIIADVWRQDP